MYNVSDVHYRPTKLRYIALILLIIAASFFLSTADPDHPRIIDKYVIIFFIGIWVYAMARDVKAQKVRSKPKRNDGNDSTLQ
jgi:predicted tellurium resistance membrane protein TerC